MSADNKADRHYQGRLVGPRGTSRWLAWREARNRKIAKATRAKPKEPPKS